MNTSSAWPAVFSEPLAAPYRPEITDPWLRSGAAIMDGLAAWGNCHAGKTLGLTVPPSFGEVIMKLQNAAGIAGATPEAFSAAASAWRNERAE